MNCTDCGASGYGLHHSAQCKYLNVDIYKEIEQLQARIKSLLAENEELNNDLDLHDTIVATYKAEIKYLKELLKNEKKIIS